MLNSNLRRYMALYILFLLGQILDKTCHGITVQETCVTCAAADTAGVEHSKQDGGQRSCWYKQK